MAQDQLTEGSLRFKRVLLKLSGESFSHAGERGIGMDEVLHIARQVQQAAQFGCQIALDASLDGLTVDLPPSQY